MDKTKISVIQNNSTLTEFKNLISNVVGQSVEKFLKIKINKASIFDEIVSIIDETREHTIENYNNIDTFLTSESKDAEKDKKIEQLKNEIDELKCKLESRENKCNVSLIIEDEQTLNDETMDSGYDSQSEETDKMINKELYKNDDGVKEDAEEDAEEEGDVVEDVEETEEEIEEETEEERAEERAEEYAEETEETEEEEDVEEDAENEENEKEDAEEEYVEEDAGTEEEEDVEEPEEEHAEETEEEEDIEEDEEELFEIEIDGVSYFTNDDDLENGDLYEINDEDEPGSIVGSIRDGEITLFEDS